MREGSVVQRLLRGATRKNSRWKVGGRIRTTWHTSLFDQPFLNCFLEFFRNYLAKYLAIIILSSVCARSLVYFNLHLIFNLPAFIYIYIIEFIASSDKIISREMNEGEKNRGWIIPPLGKFLFLILRTNRTSSSKVSSSTPRLNASHV